MGMALLQNSIPEISSEPLANIDAEACILGGMMTHNEFISDVADIVRADDFFEPLHGRIFTAILAQDAMGKKATPPMLKGYFENDEAMNVFGGVRYLARLTVDSAGPIGPVQYAIIVADLARRRTMRDSLRAAIEACENPVAPIAEAIALAETATAIRSEDETTEADTAECVASFLADLESDAVGVRNYVISSFDELADDLLPGSMTILAGRPGSGKTAVAATYARAAAQHGQGTLFVELEMTKNQLIGRMIADQLFDDERRRVPYSAIRARDLNDFQRARVNEASREIATLPMVISDPGGLPIGRLETLVRRQKRRFAARGVPLQLVVVDYLQLLRPDVRMKDAYQAVSEISIRLKALAKNQEVAILALAQLSRSVEQRADKRPVLSDLRDSGQIEQDADAVMFLYREEYYLSASEPQDSPDEHSAWEAKMERCRGVIQFILAKRRDGATGSRYGRFFGPYQAVRG